MPRVNKPWQPELAGMFRIRIKNPADDYRVRQNIDRSATLMHDS